MGSSTWTVRRMPKRKGSALKNPCKTVAVSIAFVLCCLVTLGCQSKVVEHGAKPVAMAKANQRFSLIAAPTGKDAAARKVLLAMDEGDTDTLYSYSDPVEIEDLHLTKKSLQALVDLYLRERGKMQSLGVTECRPFARDGSMCVETRRTDKADFAVDAMVYPTKTGLKSLVSQALIKATQDLMWVRERGGPPDAADLPFRLKCEEFFGSELGPKGIGGFVFLSWQDVMVRMVTWKDLIEHTRSQIKEPIYSGHLPRGTHQ